MNKCRYFVCVCPTTAELWTAVKNISESVLPFCRNLRLIIVKRCICNKQSAQRQQHYRRRSVCLLLQHYNGRKEPARPPQGTHKTCR